MKTRTVAERLAAKIELDPATGCLNFTGSVSRNGYGQIYGGKRGQQLRTHRVAYELARGPVPEGLVLDHLCRNRRCCNPDHMEVVTNGENVRRGDGITATNARKTTCSRGHPFDEANTKIHHRPTGPRRRCLECDRARAREAARRARERKREASAQSLETA